MTTLNLTFKLSLIVCMTLSGLFLTSCSPLEILPGLCYTDKTGTYVCPEKIEKIDPLPEYDRKKECMMIYGIDPDQWRMCMDPDNDHYYDPYYEQRKERKEIEGEIERRERQSIRRSIERVAQQSYNPIGLTSYESKY